MTARTPVTWSALRDAINTIREETVDNPVSMHGNKTTIYDFMLDSGVDLKAGHGQVTALRGLDVFYNEDMASGVIEIRDRQGRTWKQLVELNGQWYSLDLSRIWRG